jgi:hypothetical protein
MCGQTQTSQDHITWYPHIISLNSRFPYHIPIWYPYYIPLYPRYLPNHSILRIFFYPLVNYIILLWKITIFNG